MDEFLTWKETQESSNFVYYSKPNATTKSKDGTYSLSYYRCQKNGSSIPRKARKTTRRNRKGVVKTNSFCPSRLICKTDQNGEVSVTYIHTHSHNIQFKDTEHHPIPRSILNFIKQKLLLGSSEDYIHKALREGRDDRNNRGNTDGLQKKHIISKRQIKEVARKLKINRRLHSDDANSVGMIINNLIKEEHNPVLVYKAQGKDNFTALPPHPNEYKIKKGGFYSRYSN